ncbi:MAG: Sec-independent protein translocase protein TatB [Pseudomonadota bacterium]|jgi:sec-independent protein translocase protein TatB
MLPEAGAFPMEMLMVAVVALIVIGPKDLPVLLRRLGQFIAKMRGLAAEFRASFDEMARQSELDELRRQVEELKQTGFTGHPVSPELQAHMSAIHEELNGPAPQPDPSLAYEPAPLHVEAAPTPADLAASGAALAVAAEAPAEPVADAPVKKPRKPRAKKVAAPVEAAPASSSEDAA